ncbi:MAG: glycosyltransferase family 4 protein [Candidatus Zixiibacteriota bacterium]|nr:MAG: glycosyltransferase family 4 protein [candidate division Zixibacteria bacterium]
MTAKRILMFGWADSVHMQRWCHGMASRGYSIRLISAGGSPLDGIDTVIHPRTGSLSYLRYARKAAREARDFNPDLVHVHYVSAFGLWGLLCGPLPMIASVWGSDIDRKASGPPAGFITRRTLNRAIHICATSSFLADLVQQLDPAFGSKTTVIPFGVQPPDNLPPTPTAPPVRICFLKTLRPASGSDILIAAMKRAVETEHDLRLSIAGEGELLTELRRMVSDLGLGQHVEFVGRIEQEEVYPFVSRHHFMVMPSRREAFGVAALEAAACARAVLASDVGGIPEVVRDGDTGILIPPEDSDKLAAAIVRLARDANLREKMGQSGREFVKRKYLWDRSLDLMASLYNRIIDERRTHTAI